MNLKSKCYTIIIILIVIPFSRYILGEIKTYLRGMAECAMRKPALGLELCMRQYWINLGNQIDSVMAGGRLFSCLFPISESDRDLHRPI